MYGKGGSKTASGKRQMRKKPFRLEAERHCGGYRRTRKKGQPLNGFPFWGRPVSRPDRRERILGLWETSNHYWLLGKLLLLFRDLGRKVHQNLCNLGAGRGTGGVKAAAANPRLTGKQAGADRPADCRNSPVRGGASVAVG